MTQREHHIPRKRFGQNFLHDKAVIQRIVGSFSISASDQLLEIGPGLGALTGVLINTVTPIHVVELDRDLISRLQQTFSPEHVIIHEADALDFNYCSITADAHKKIRVIGNLPYNISTPLIFHILEQITCIKDMCFMLQKEVVQRLCAAPGSKAYGRLSVMVQYWCQVERLFDVRSGAFTPAPKVDSAIVHLIPHKMPPAQVIHYTDFEDIVRAAFSQRRKTIRNGLKQYLSGDEIEKTGVNPGLRAETIDITAFAALSNAVTAKKKI